jgi:hypothetical protein
MRHFTGEPMSGRCAKVKSGLWALLALLALAGCDAQRISELEEGVATEADVRARFGAPETVWDEPGGSRVLEYNRQPAGQRNYMITVGPDGRMTALRQVLTPANFAGIQPGMNGFGGAQAARPAGENDAVRTQARSPCRLALPRRTQHVDGVHGGIRPG